MDAALMVSGRDGLLNSIWVAHLAKGVCEALKDSIVIACCVVFQTDDWTPLQIASQNGHVDCVRALLGGGATIDKARVGRAIPHGIVRAVRGASWDWHVIEDVDET